MSTWSRKYSYITELKQPGYVRIKGGLNNFPCSVFIGPENQDSPVQNIDTTNFSIASGPDPLDVPLFSGVTIGLMAALSLMLILAITFMILYFRARRRFQRPPYYED